MEQIDFQLNAEFIELNQLLKLVGICSSGGAGKVLVAKREVKVDGAIETRKTCKIRAGQIVCCGSTEISVLSAD
jgi:ribosome-associated protein